MVQYKGMVTSKLWLVMETATKSLKDRLQELAKAHRKRVGGTFKS